MSQRNNCSGTCAIHPDKIPTVTRAFKIQCTREPVEARPKSTYVRARLSCHAVCQGKGHGSLLPYSSLLGNGHERGRGRAGPGRVVVRPVVKAELLANGNVAARFEPDELPPKVYPRGEVASRAVRGRVVDVPDEGGSEWSAIAIGARQCSSVTISAHQWPSVVISPCRDPKCVARLMREAIRCHQCTVPTTTAKGPPRRCS